MFKIYKLNVEVWQSIHFHKENYIINAFSVKYLIKMQKILLDATFINICKMCVCVEINIIDKFMSDVSSLHILNQ